jgi:hypothetical protein
MRLLLKTRPRSAPWATVIAPSSTAQRPWTRAGWQAVHPRCPRCDLLTAAAGTDGPRRGKTAPDGTTAISDVARHFGWLASDTKMSGHRAVEG